MGLEEQLLNETPAHRIEQDRVGVINCGGTRSTGADSYARGYRARPSLREWRNVVVRSSG
jgi:hypothetical protein